MTLREFGCAVEGYNRQQKQLLQLAAWHAANVMNPHTKRKITPRKLLGSQGSTSRRDVESRLREAAARESESIE